MPGDSDIVTIVTGGGAISGWQQVRITRGIERCPSDFTIALTEKYPGQAQDIVIVPGSPFQLKLGADLVMTGYIDDYGVEYGPDGHVVTIAGRSKCQDLVDCSAELATFQINNVRLDQLATQLAAPFGIDVRASESDWAVVPQFNVTLTETPFEIIERVARWAQVLAFDTTSGDLALEPVGAAAMASGFAEGVNCEHVASRYSMAERFTEIRSVYTNTETFTQVPGNPLPEIAGTLATDTSFPSRADGQPRYRPLIIVSEQDIIGAGLAAKRAQWEMARRVGRSQSVNLRCDSWRDSAGALWEVNRLATVNLPTAKLVNKTWLISEIAFLRDDGGTHAEVTLMPPQAFVPQPEVLQPFQWQVSQALTGQGAQASGTDTNAAADQAAEAAVPIASSFQKSLGGAGK